MEPDYFKKEEYIYSTLAKGVSITYRKDDFKITNLDRRKVGSGNYITGVLTKYKPDFSEKVLNEENQVQEQVIHNKVLEQVRFIFDVHESLFIYEGSRAFIPKETVAERIKEIFQVNAGEGYLKMSIKPITEKYTFYQRLENIKQLKKIRIELKPSNPNHMEMWEDFDKKMKAEELTHYTEIQENKNPNQSIKVDDDTKSKIYMGEDGYGQVSASGYDKNGKPIKITTRETDQQAKIDIVGQDNFEQEIEDIKQKIIEIKSKTVEQGTIEGEAKNEDNQQA